MAKTERKEDLRVRKTNKMLNEAITELLQTKSIDKISVVELCDAAQIHRATFYKHYKDKDAFIEHIISMQIDKLYAEAKRQSESEELSAYIHTIAELTLDFTEKNKNYIISNSQSAEGAQLLIMLSDVISRELKNQLQKYMAGCHDDNILEVISHYLAGGFIDIISWWLRSDSDMTRDELIDCIEKLILSDKSFDGYGILSESK